MTAPLSLIGYRWASFLATPLAGPDPGDAA